MLELNLQFHRDQSHLMSLLNVTSIATENTLVNKIRVTLCHTHLFDAISG